MEAVKNLISMLRWVTAASSERRARQHQLSGLVPASISVRCTVCVPGFWVLERGCEWDRKRKEKLFWGAGLELGKDRTTQKGRKNSKCCIYNAPKYLFMLKKGQLVPLLFSGQSWYLRWCKGFGKLFTCLKHLPRCMRRNFSLLQWPQKCWLGVNG